MFEFNWIIFVHIVQIELKFTTPNLSHFFPETDGVIKPSVDCSFNQHEIVVNPDCLCPDCSYCSCSIFMDSVICHHLISCCFSDRIQYPGLFPKKFMNKTKSKKRKVNGTNMINNFMCFVSFEMFFLCDIIFIKKNLCVLLFGYVLFLFFMCFSTSLNFWYFLSSFLETIIYQRHD